MIAVLIALAACFYLFNENKKTKADIALMKSVKSTIQAPTVVVSTKPPPTRKKMDTEPEPETED